MSETLSIAEFKELQKKRPGLGRTKGNGDKAKGEMEMVLKLMGLDYQTEHTFHPTRKWRFDFAIPSRKIAIEYEGIVADKSRHTNIKGYTEDSNKYNEAQKLGWKVLRYTALNYKNMTNDLMELNG